jgi:hypothetical protein
VERLFGALKASLQDASVFRDLGGIEIGEDWMDKIREAINECYAFLVVIGPAWFELDDSAHRESTSVATSCGGKSKGRSSECRARKRRSFLS